MVKDLSRIGRHKAYSALFLEYLKQQNIKLISVTEGIDNFNENDDLIIGFKQIINEQYAKDISRKVRSGFKQKQKEGFVIIPPFGYVKDKSTNKIEINEECADIVRLIYKLYLDGYGIKKVSEYLTQNRYNTPSWYQNQSMGKTFHPGKKWIGRNIWSDVTVSRILENDAYIGCLRCGITSRSAIYKYRKTIPEDEHIVHENFYPPIIDKDTWNMAQSIRENRSKNNVRASTNKKVHRYAGLLICKDCGASFVAKRRKYNGKEYIEYVCNGYHRFGINVCTSHRVKESELDNIVYSYLLTLKDVAKENLGRVDQFIKEWNYKKRDYTKFTEKIQLQIYKLKEEIKSYSRQLAKKLINEELFKELSKENIQKIDMLEKHIKTLDEVKEINNQAKSRVQNSIYVLNRILENEKM